MISYDESKIAYHYGFENQLRQLQEEAGELISAVNRLCRKMNYYSVEPPKRFIKDQWDSVVEELADLTLMADQVIELMAVRDDVEKVRKQKVKRQLKRMEDEEIEDKDYY